MNAFQTGEPWTSTAVVSAMERPMRAAVGRLGVERQHHDFVIFDGARLSRPAFVVQTHEALGAEALAPLADRLAAGPNLFGDRLVIEPIGAQKHVARLTSPAARLRERERDSSSSRVPLLTSSGFNGRPRSMASPSSEWMRGNILYSCHYVHVFTGHDTSSSFSP